jgi:hypothetical protein
MQDRDQNLEIDMDTMYRQMAGEPLYSAERLAAGLTKQLPAHIRPDFEAAIQTYAQEVRAEIQAVYNAQKGEKAQPDMDVIIIQMERMPLSVIGKLAEKLVMQLPENRRIDFIGSIQTYCQGVHDKIQVVYDDRKG